LVSPNSSLTVWQILNKSRRRAEVVSMKIDGQEENPDQEFFQTLRKDAE